MVRSAFVFAIAFLLSLYVFAGADYTALIKNSGDASAYPGQNTLVIFDSTDVDMQPTGLTYVKAHKLVKILTDEGAKQNHVIKFGYDPLSAFVEIQGVTVYRKDGSIETIDLSKVQDYPAPARAIYWGAREIMIGVGRLQPGDALDILMFRKGFTYALLYGDDDKYIPPMKGHYYDIIEFWSSDPVITKVYRVKVPQDKYLQYEFYNGEITSSVYLENGKWVYTFTKKNLQPPKRESNMVADSDVFPELLLSTSPDWKAKSLWFHKVNEDFGSFETTPDITAKVNEILKGAASEMDSVSRLTHWVADEIRYSGISMGEGEGFTLHKGEMTFTDRCGVCKDKAGMLITMLRAAGFESYPAMTMAGSRIDYIPADQFNHCVTVVKLSDEQYHLLDPTWVPFIRELWSSAEQQQNYLMGVPEGWDLSITPVSNPENHYIHIEGNTELLENGTLKGSLVLTAEGQSDGSIRRSFTGNFVSDWQDAMERELLRVSPAAKVASVDYGNPYVYMSGPIRVTISFEIPDYAIVTDEELIFIPLLSRPVFKNSMGHLFLNTDLKERKYPFRDRCSRLVEINENVKLYAGKNIIKAPGNMELKGTTASFNGSITLTGTDLSVNQKISLGKRIYETSDWKEVRDAVLAQMKYMDEPVIISLK